MSSFSQFLKLTEESSLYPISGFGGSSYSFYLWEKFCSLKLDFLIILPLEEEARRLASDLKAISGQDSAILFYPAYDRLDSELLPPNALTVFDRLKCLERMATDSSPVLVVSTQAAVDQGTISSKRFLDLSLTLVKEQDYSLDSIRRKLIGLGYRREEMVASRGEFSQRGDILDLYPSTSDKPYRLEFFGDTLESIREFDLYTQRSIGDVDSLSIYSVQEFDRENFELSQDLPPEVTEYFAKRSKNALSDIVLEGLSGLEWLNPYCKDSIKISDWRSRFIKPRKTAMDSRIEPIPYFGKNMEVFLKKIKDSVEQGFQVVLFLPKKGFSQRISGLLKGASKVTLLENWVDLLSAKAKVLMVEQTLSAGFESNEFKLLVLTYSDFTGTVYREDEKKNSQSNFSGDVLHHFSELVQGDFVIHQDYGVAQFKGIETITMDSIQKEYLVLQYAGTDRVLVPITDVDRIHRHTPVRDGAPVLNKLNSVRWNQVKSKVKEAVEQYARELLEHYAKREVAQGFQFSVDNESVRSLEDGFEYDETRDQLKAVSEIKRDMQRPEPMDRLLCGDVGYGKTEVAIRAAFKAVQDQKQVAVLCPTTILAQQHFQTFSSRLLGTGARVEVLNRFVDAKRQKEIVRSLKLGEVDIVIGTHRILSQDVQFNDLGLLVVDEEQRFGVSHKEKLRQLRRGVDTLMMSATPIPRTLHMSLGGARAISVIQTPPTGRLPVKTFVLPWQESTIKEAIERELRRKGQVFYVYNRVETIASKANQLLRLIPNLKLRWLHGQMEAQEIEEVMTGFMRREFDVLLATTIIESGMDIPNVNTILVDEADNFGLAQLYQLRGRIGRRDIQGYAYLFYKQESSLTTVARKRLFALEEFTDLGAGFKIAMRDMEIRGAGNLLGKSQSGHVHSIGFDLYSRLLRDAIERLQDENFQEEVDMPQVELKVNAFLNDKYIPSYRERMDFFRRLSWLRNLESLEELQKECFDRYGALPPEMRQLFKVITLRIQSHWFEVRRFSQLNNQVMIDFHKTLNPTLLDLAKRKFMRMVEASSNFPERMLIRFPVIDSDKLLDQLIGFFSRENCDKVYGVKVKDIP